jgi:RNA polymerase sigma factor for flagellar operon FliA
MGEIMMEEETLAESAETIQKRPARSTRMKPMANEAEVWQLIVKGDPEARDRMIQQYVYLVKFVLNRLVSYPHLDQDVLDFDDLYSAGVIGLIKAVDHFDPKRDVKFITYAIPRIRGAIIDELRAIDWLPRSMRQKVNRLHSAYTKIENDHLRPATDEEVSSYLGITLDEFRQLLSSASRSIVLSLDEELRLSDDSHITRGDQAMRSERSCRDMVAREELVNILTLTVEALPEKERLVVAMYYYDEMTFREIGKVLSVTESRICQLHTKAMLRLRSRLKDMEHDFGRSV